MIAPLSLITVLFSIAACFSAMPAVPELGFFVGVAINGDDVAEVSDVSFLFTIDTVDILLISARNNIPIRQT